MVKMENIQHSAGLQPIKWMVGLTVGHCMIALNNVVSTACSRSNNTFSTSPRLDASSNAENKMKTELNTGTRYFASNFIFTSYVNGANINIVWTVRRTTLCF